MNPLTLVHGENKPISLCVDARGVNRHTNPVKVKVSPLGELLQRFHRSSYISTLHRSSVSPQVLLSKPSRKWTAFNFENHVYQFTSVRYGYKKSLSSFIRALQKVLEGEKNVTTYVDNLVLHSRDFDDHLATLDSVRHKLTSAVFTINAHKCQLCRPEIKFLEYIISDCILRPEPRRIEAIFPTPSEKPETTHEVSRNMQLPPLVHCELRTVRRAFVDTFVKRDQMELAAHYS